MPSLAWPCLGRQAVESGKRGGPPPTRRAGARLAGLLQGVRTQVSCVHSQRVLLPSTYPKPLTTDPEDQP